MGKEDNTIILKSDSKNNVSRLSNRTEVHTAIIGKDCVTIKGRVDNVYYEKTFFVNQLVEYDSDFSGSLYGKIRRIYTNRIVIVDRDKIYTLTLYNFAKKNWDFSENRMKF